MSREEGMSNETQGQALPVQRIEAPHCPQRGSRPDRETAAHAAAATGFGQALRGSTVSTRTMNAYSSVM